MAAISGAIPNLIGGVSQQPPEIRAVNSHSALLNSWSDVATGLSTRPPGVFTGTLGPSPASGKTVATHTIQKPSGKFLVAVYGGSVRVLNLDTRMEETVTVESPAGSYINVDDAARNIGFCTVGDTTFIYNRAKTVTVTKGPESGASGRTDEGVVRLNPNRYGTVWVKQRAGYNASYAVYVNNVLKASRSTDDAMPADIADSFLSSLNSAGNPTTAYGRTVLSLAFANETDFVTAADDFADQAIVAYNDFVDEFADLPRNEREGRLIMIRQSFDSDEDDYWVWKANGRYEETYGWNAYEKPDNSAMPVILFDNGDGTWTLKETDWPGRTIGDEKSNPSPSFVGRTIRSMFIYKGRMVILADENFIASRVNDFENFYRSTCQQLLDDDPIDVASPESRGADLNFAKAFDKSLLVFSKFDQFRVEGDSEGLLSPNTVSIRHVNSYNCTEDVEPVIIGANVVFIDDFNDGRFAALREYQIERVFGREIALPITDQIPEYIESGVYKMVQLSTANNVAIVSTGDRKKLWLYNYYYNNEGKVQSSWQQWSYPGDIFSVDVVDDRLMVSIVYGGSLHVLEHVFDAGADLILDDDSVLLDFKVPQEDLEITLDGSDTLVTFPYNLEANYADDLLAVIAPTNTGGLSPGRTYKPSSKSGNVARFANVDLSAQEFLVGFRYRFYWKLSPIYVRDRNSVAIQDGRLQLRHLSFLYNHSGPFAVYVTPEGRETYTKRFSGFTVGSATDTLNRLSLDSGQFRVTASGEGHRNIIEVDAWTPWRVRFSSLEWDGAYRAKNKRTT